MLRASPGLKSWVNGVKWSDKCWNGSLPIRGRVWEGKLYRQFPFQQVNRWPLRKQCMRKPKSSLPTRSPLTHSTCISLSQERAPAKVEWTCPPQSTPLRRPRLNYIQRRSNVLLRLKHRLDWHSCHCA